MDELSLFLRICLGMIFLSSVLSKIHKVQEHILIVKDYKMMPRYLTPIVARIIILVEIIIGVLLLLGAMIKVASALSVFILLLYIISIIVNLLRGRTEMSCGCGGIAGNHHLSWLLVIRNIIFIAISIWLLRYGTLWGGIRTVFDNGLHDIFQPSILQTIVAAIGFLILYSVVHYLINIKGRMKELL